MKKFPYGYDVNAYIDKAFEQLKENFPWATRDMIAEDTNLDIEKMGDDYQYVRFYMENGIRKSDPIDIECAEFISRLYSGHEWRLEHANPVKEEIDVPTTTTNSGDWFLEIYRIRKHVKGGYSTYVQAGNRSAGGSRTYFIPASYFKLPWEEFLGKYLDLVTAGACYVDRSDLKNCPGLKEFLGY